MAAGPSVHTSPTFRTSRDTTDLSRAYILQQLGSYGAYGCCDHPAAADATGGQKRSMMHVNSAAFQEAA